jgi:hypothetical protein
VAMSATKAQSLCRLLWLHCFVFAPNQQQHGTQHCTQVKVLCSAAAQAPSGGFCCRCSLIAQQPSSAVVNECISHPQV